MVDPAKEAHFGHRLSHASVSSGNETANSSLIRSESTWWQPFRFYLDSSSNSGANTRDCFTTLRNSGKVDPHGHTNRLSDLSCLYLGSLPR